MLELSHLYPHLSRGGAVMMDDGVKAEKENTTKNSHDTHTHTHTRTVFWLLYSVTF